MKIATFDIETDGLYPKLTTVWCAAVKDHSTGDVITFDPSNIARLCSFLATYDVLIGHNCIDFDFPTLRKIFGWEYEGKKVDTLIMSRFQNPKRTLPPGYTGRAPHSVEAWGMRVGNYKIEHEDWTQYSPEMLERCKQDVEVQYQIYNALRNEAKGQNWSNAHKMNMKLFHYLQLQEEYGWTVDIEHLDKSMHTLNRWMERIERAVQPHLPYIVEKLENGDNYVKKPFKKDGSYSAVVQRYFDGPDMHYVSGPFSRVRPRPISISSAMELKDFLLEQGWKPEQWNTDSKGNRTTPKLSKDDPFHGIEGAVGKLITKRVLCRQRLSILEGWKNALRPDGKLSPRVNGVATTGRLRHALIVNIPSPDSGAFFAKQMRQCFIAKPGWVMVGCDSKGNQMRQLAARMQDEDFTYAVLHGTKEEGTDLHTLNMNRAGLDNRTHAKNFFYGGILFGAGNPKIARMLSCSVDHAKELKEDYFKEMPKLKEVIEDLSEDWRKSAEFVYNNRFHKMEYKNGYIEGIDGRPILVEFEKDLLCYALQSDEAIQMAVAYVILHKWAEKRGWILGKDWGMLIWYHDEFQMESKPELAEELGKLAAKSIKYAGEYLNIQCPHDGDYAIGKSWYETH